MNARVLVALVALASPSLALGGCRTTSDTQPSVQAMPGSGAASAAKPVASPSTATRQELEAFGALHVPDDARELTIERAENAAGEPVYHARFATSEEGAKAFCDGGGLGGALARDEPIDDKTRAEFELAGDRAKALFGCSASSPGDPRIQREVLVTSRPPNAVVHVVAFRMPVR